MQDRFYPAQKASIWAPFVVLAFFCSPYAYALNCQAKQFDETVQVSHVYDGDTVKLSDGRKVRFIGINTPERGRDGRPHEPFYKKASQELEKLINHSDSRLKIIYGKEKHDRYKRILAHPFTFEGKNISALLLEKGMGFTVTVPPNLAFLPCYQQAETTARNAKKGIWGHSFSAVKDVDSLSTKAGGFQRVKGTVQRVGESRSAYWLNLRRGFALRILKKDIGHFTTYHPRDLLHKKLIARGWVSYRNKELRMTIRHPASLQLLDTD